LIIDNVNNIIGKKLIKWFYNGATLSIPNNYPTLAPQVNFKALNIALVALSSAIVFGILVTLIFYFCERRNRPIDFERVSVVKV